MNNKVEVAGINTSSLKTLSDSRAAELMMKMKNGDRAARDEFITGNLRLVLAEIGKLRLRWTHGVKPTILHQKSVRPSRTSCSSHHRNLNRR